MQRWHCHFSKCKTQNNLSEPEMFASGGRQNYHTLPQTIGRFSENSYLQEDHALYYHRSISFFFWWMTFWNAG